MVCYQGQWLPGSPLFAILLPYFVVDMSAVVLTLQCVCRRTRTPREVGVHADRAQARLVGIWEHRYRWAFATWDTVEVSLLPWGTTPLTNIPNAVCTDLPKQGSRRQRHLRWCGKILQLNGYGQPESSRSAAAPRTSVSGDAARSQRIVPRAKVCDRPSASIWLTAKRSAEISNLRFWV